MVMVVGSAGCLAAFSLPSYTLTPPPPPPSHLCSHGGDDDIGHRYDLLLHLEQVHQVTLGPAGVEHQDAAPE